jgi:hypothetical protein
MMPTHTFFTVNSNVGISFFPLVFSGLLHTVSLQRLPWASSQQNLELQHLCPNKHQPLCLNFKNHIASLLGKTVKTPTQFEEKEHKPHILTAGV